ncbi:MAG: hypothetical protein KKE50_00445, partial [Nanoarchaeota archaeon]|nr:hypothetical protein [Nanoarchaeota archaeon]
DGAKEVINTLKQKNKIIFITSRHLEWKQKTLDFIKKHFPADNVRKVNCTLQCADSCEQLSFSEHPENPKQTAPFKVRYTQGFLDFQIIFSGDVYGGKCKEEICRELDIPVIIEDHHEKSIDYANAGIKVILFNRPWNKKLSHENITRVKNWGEILEEIEKLV